MWRTPYTRVMVSMTTRRLYTAAKQLLNSRLTEHSQCKLSSSLSDIPQQAAVCEGTAGSRFAFSTEKTASFSHPKLSKDSSNDKAPRVASGVADKPKHTHPSGTSRSEAGHELESDGGRYLKSSYRSGRPYDATVVEKKKKKSTPPGPVQFESLTAKTPCHSDLPFAFRHSYTEIPKVAPVGFQEKFSPFGPNRLDRDWDGQQAFPATSSSSWRSSSSSSPSSSSSSSEDHNGLNITKSKYNFKGVKLVTAPSPIVSGTRHRRTRAREQILGEPLTKEEITELVENSIKSRRQINVGRDGLTHNMLIEVHDHWKRECVVRMRCKGVPTVDMENVLFQLEDKTGGKIIQRAGGTVYLFRGRNYSYKDRPVIPPMLWKPHSPLYPKLITETPGGLKVHEANFLRKRGLKIMPLCKLAKNGYYGDLVHHVREAFEDDFLVRIDCKGLNTSDYKRIGGKLRDLVPCILLSFEKEQIVLWNGKDHKKCITESSNQVGETQGANLPVDDDAGKDVDILHGDLEDGSGTCVNSDDALEDAGRCQFLGDPSSDTSDACEDVESLNAFRYSMESGDMGDSSDVGADNCEDDEAINVSSGHVTN